MKWDENPWLKESQNCLEIINGQVQSATNAFVDDNQNKSVNITLLIVRAIRNKWYYTNWQFN